MMASCVVTLSKSRFDKVVLSRQPSSALYAELVTFLRISIANKLCSRRARFTALDISRSDVARLNVAVFRFSGINELHIL